jgi:hypothetical protein
MACTWLRGNGDDPPLAHRGVTEVDAVPAGRHSRGKSSSAGAYWVGVDRERPVRPEDIERAEPFAGHLVPLDDGQIWTVPTARDCRIPRAGRSRRLLPADP